jgi:hypothetical protein
MAKKHKLKLRGARPRRRSRSSAWDRSSRSPSGSRQPPRFIVLRARGGKAKGSAHRASSARASPSTPAASRSSPRRDGRDEVRHVRRRRRARRHEVPSPMKLPAQRRRPRARHREHARRQGREARRHRHHDVGPDHRDPQHRRRGPPHPVRRPHLRRALSSPRRDRRGDAHGRLRDRARARGLGSDGQPRRPRPELLQAGETAWDRAWQLPLWDDYQEPSRATSPTSPTSGQPRGGRLHHRGLLPVALRQGLPLGAPRHRRHGLAKRRREGRDGPTRSPCSPTSSRGGRRDAHRLLPLRRGQAALRLPPRRDRLRARKPARGLRRRTSRRSRTSTGCSGPGSPPDSCPIAARANPSRPRRPSSSRPGPRTSATTTCCSTWTTNWPPFFASLRATDRDRGHGRRGQAARPRSATRSTEARLRDPRERDRGLGRMSLDDPLGKADALLKRHAPASAADVPVLTEVISPRHSPRRARGAFPARARRGGRGRSRVAPRRRARAAPHRAPGGRSPVVRGRRRGRPAPAHRRGSRRRDLRESLRSSPTDPRPGTQVDRIRRAGAGIISPLYRHGTRQELRAPRHRGALVSRTGSRAAISRPASTPPRPQLLHPAAAAQRHRHAAHGPRLPADADGRAHALPPHARLQRCGSPAPTTPASPRRSWSSASSSRKASPATTSAARSSSSACGPGRRSPAPPSRARCGAWAPRCDWSRERFTMDEGLCKRAVTETSCACTRKA